MQLKNFLIFLLQVLLLTIGSMALTKNEALALCEDYNFISDPQNATLHITDSSSDFLENGEVVTPQCAGGTPTGWSNLRSGARYVSTKSYTTYEKVGN